MPLESLAIAVFTRRASRERFFLSSECCETMASEWVQRRDGAAGDSLERHEENKEGNSSWPQKQGNGNAAGGGPETTRRTWRAVVHGIA